MESTPYSPKLTMPPFPFGEALLIQLEQADPSTWGLKMGQKCICRSVPGMLTSTLKKIGQIWV